ncbi:hypothetical protein [Rickettsiales endosymbiont of Stachyamoeba lipophora]|uniref:hypothetical protein n=1 Tax=Rickettsiales endosymbiont of Stachyamoeba lipophora TaxID=2486578 RepID=UPI000F649EA7|nr:hypothetical protein [Rickettsiales endosymbiont of Stachyamoeba lipophora]AZL15447.1 hypothetical protein EF513_02620 [Rickettsiales endosymbiont of Stachyamoeba lipophora]
MSTDIPIKIAKDVSQEKEYPFTNIDSPCQFIAEANYTPEMQEDMLAKNYNLEDIYFNYNNPDDEDEDGDLPTNRQLFYSTSLYGLNSQNASDQEDSAANIDAHNLPDIGISLTSLGEEQNTSGVTEDIATKTTNEHALVALNNLHQRVDIPSKDTRIDDLTRRVEALQALQDKLTKAIALLAKIEKAEAREMQLNPKHDNASKALDINRIELLKLNLSLSTKIQAEQELGNIQNALKQAKKDLWDAKPFTSKIKGIAAMFLQPFDFAAKKLAYPFQVANAWIILNSPISNYLTIQKRPHVVSIISTGITYLARLAIVSAVLFVAGRYVPGLRNLKALSYTADIIGNSTNKVINCMNLTKTANNLQVQAGTFVTMIDNKAAGVNTKSI